MFVVMQLNNKHSKTNSKIAQLIVHQEFPKLIDISLRFQSLVLPWKHLFQIIWAIQTICLTIYGGTRIKKQLYSCGDLCFMYSHVQLVSPNCKMRPWPKLKSPNIWLHQENMKTIVLVLTQINLNQSFNICF